MSRNNDKNKLILEKNFDLKSKFKPAGDQPEQSKT